MDLQGSGYLKLETAKPDRQFSHTYNLTSSLSKLEIGFAFGKIAQFFPIQMSVLLHAETDLLRLGKEWPLPRELPVRVCVRQGMVSLI